jgi:site-specific DNA recombinase
MKNTFSLVRISTILQTEEHGGTGIQFQTEKLSQYSKLNDFNLIKTIIDVCSGGLETRDGIEELKSHIENGDVDIVLIWNVSRAFRSMIHFTKFYEYLKKHDVELISVSEGIRSSSKTGSMMFGIMVSIASFEKSVITERMVSGRTTKVKSGIRGFGSKLPFGYCKNTDGEIVLDDDNSKVVQYIFRKMNSLLKNSKLTKSKRTRRLLKLLQNRNFTYNGKPFTRWNVRDILNNTFYFGELKYGEIKTNHNYEPIISKRLFNQVCVG